MEKKHSQGTLNIKKCTNDGYRVQINGASESGGCKVICWTRKEGYTPLDDKEEKANTERIVKSWNSFDDMLEALKQIDMILSDGGTITGNARTHNKIKTAIAKAENPNQ